jgi:catechol 2,3-dioxygenase-like lactoylglutathione lyase family enzyme
MNFDHIALNVKDIPRSVEWYVTTVEAKVLYQDDTWAMLDAGGVKLALTLPNQHPRHIAFDVGPSPSVEFLRKSRAHRDGNAIEWIHYPAGASPSRR